MSLVTEEKKEKEAIQNYYLLVIAIDNYEKKPLNNPVRDADALVKVLTTDYTFFKPTNPSEISYIEAQDGKTDDIIVYDSLATKCLYNEQATQSNIKTHIDKVFDSIGPDDAFLVYFSGHGIVRGGSYRLVTSSNHSFSVTELHEIFSNYGDDQKCRHLLVVLDSCFAGTSILGPVVQDNGNFSRHIVTSCKPDQVAKDGPIGIGSPFAQFIERKLSKSKKIYPELNAAFFDEFNTTLGVEYNQIFSYGVPKGETSDSVFFFLEKKNKTRPEPEFLRKSFIGKLGFKTQRGIIEEDLNSLNRPLNIITLQSYNLRERNLLAKIWFTTYLNEILSENTDIECTRIEISEGKLEDQIFRNTETNTIESVTDYFFGKLYGSKDRKKCHIFLIDFRLVGACYTDEIDVFLKKFCKQFFEKLNNNASLTASVDIGKLFVFFTDEIQGLHGWSIGDFKNLIEAKNSMNFNFIDFGQLKPLNKISFTEWQEEVRQDQIVENLGLSNIPVILGLFGIKELDQFRQEHYNFIYTICKHCGFDEKEFKTEFENQIYNFPKMI